MPPTPSLSKFLRARVYVAQGVSVANAHVATRMSVCKYCRNVRVHLQVLPKCACASILHVRIHQTRVALSPTRVLLQKFEIANSHREGHAPGCGESEDAIMDAQARWRKRCHHIGPCTLPCPHHQRGSHGRRHGADEGGAGGRET
jgi:hypothetical protein